MSEAPARWYDLGPFWRWAEIAAVTRSSDEVSGRHKLKPEYELIGVLGESTWVLFLEGHPPGLVRVSPKPDDGADSYLGPWAVDVKTTASLAKNVRLLIPLPDGAKKLCADYYVLAQIHLNARKGRLLGWTNRETAESAPVTEPGGRWRRRNYLVDQRSLKPMRVLPILGLAPRARRTREAPGRRTPCALGESAGS